MFACRRAALSITWSFDNYRDYDDEKSGITRNGATVACRSYSFGTITAEGLAGAPDSRAQLDPTMRHSAWLMPTNWVDTNPKKRDHIPFAQDPQGEYGTGSSI